MLDEITQFKLTLRLYLHIFGAVAASFFGALQLSREEFIQAPSLYWAACILFATSNTALKLSGDLPLSALAPPLSSPLCCAIRRLGSVVIPV